MKRHTLALILSALPVVFSGATSHAGGRPEKPERIDAAQVSEPGPRSLSLSGKGSKLPDADVVETDKFIQANSPNRYRRMKEKNIRVGREMVSRFVEMRNLRTEDEALYNLRVEEMKQEDVIFSIVSTLKANPGDPTLKAAFDEQVGKLIDLRINEHDHRIAKLEELLAAEKAKRSKLQNREKAIEVREKVELRQNEAGIGFAPGAGNVRREQSELPQSGPAQ